MSVNMRRRAPLQYPVISEGFVFLDNGHVCPYLNIRSRCIPLAGASHLRSTYDACLSRWGVLWRFYGTCIWTTRETFIDHARWFDKSLDQP